VEKDAGNLEFRQTRRDVMNRKAEILVSKGETEEAVKIFRTAYRQYLATPMLQDKAAERDYYEGLMHERIGNVYQRMTETSATRGEKLRAQLQNAIDNYQKALEHWQKPETVAEFFETNKEQMENLRARMEDCKVKLAGS
jgi:tetratricopeptide (TPR) repeat protein